MENTKNKSFLIKLKDGDYGLAKTFWLYYIATIIPVTILLKILDILLKLDLIFVLFGVLFILIPVIVYSIFSMIGVWRAANNYQGLRLWSVLAKILMILRTILGGILQFGMVMAPIHM